MARGVIFDVDGTLVERLDSSLAGSVLRGEPA
jgi:phosphoglycolate phosphatase-like HAD superfamily hydrolase